MNVEEARALLEEIGESASGYMADVGTLGVARHAFAYLTLTSHAHPGWYATLSTPGVNWFELEVTGGFYTGRTDDQAQPDDVAEYLAIYLEYAMAYLNGHWSAGRSRFSRAPLVLITAQRGTLRLGKGGSSNRASTAGL